MFRSTQSHVVFAVKMSRLHIVQAAILIWHHGAQRLFVRIIFGFDSRLHSARQIPRGAKLWLAVFYISAFAWTVCGVIAPDL